MKATGLVLSYPHTLPGAFAVVSNVGTMGHVSSIVFVLLQKSPPVALEFCNAGIKVECV